MLKKFLSAFLLLTVYCLLFIKPIFASEKIDLYFFYSDSCPHCAREAQFLQKISPEYPQLIIHDHTVSSPDGAKLYQEFTKRLNLKRFSVPLTIIDNQYISGFLNAETTGQEIIELIEEKTTTPSRIINLPIFGQLDTEKISLPLITIAIAAVDGFNPCAMWTLVFLISLLLGMKNRRRMWFFGFTFIFISGIVYFLFLSAWLNLFLFIGFTTWIRLIIGGVAIFSAIHHFKEFFTNPQADCKVSSSGSKQKLSQRLKQAIETRSILLALSGLIIVAFSVNLIELVCSAGLPAIFTNILSLTPLTSVEYYSLLLLYILIFMLDDMVIFVIAMLTLRYTGLSTKYTRYSNLIGGFIIGLLGILLIFKPELIMFN